MKPRVIRVAVGLLMMIASAAGAWAGIATVTQDIPTSFATYHPALVSVKPQARQYTVAPDLANVSNLARFNFTAAQKELLRQNGFFARHADVHEMDEVYLDCERSRLPTFVTVDFMLHVMHKQFDDILMTLEKEKFSGALTTMTAALLGDSLAAYAAAQGDAAKQALAGNAAYFAVASALLGTTQTLPEPVKTLADAELALIDAHNKYIDSPLFGAQHDYTQFIVRGHYAGDPQLERFFRAMMWYGTMRFTLSVSPGLANRPMALRAVLVAQKLHGSADWRRIYQPTAFLVGEANRLAPPALDRIAAGIYGPNYLSLTADQLADPEKLDALCAQARAEAPPQINPEEGICFSLMGQRYIVDSFILKATMTPDRLPRGLDVMAVLGSPRAEALLRDAYQEMTSDLATSLETLKATFSAYPASAWVQNAYWNWLYCLAPVVEPKGAGYPPFMRSPAWQDKDLAAALGSWTELRHDTILYGQQSHSWGFHPLVGVEQGYVEPNPEAFARLSAMLRYLRDGLSGMGLPLNTKAEQANAKIQDVLLKLKSIAEQELAGQVVSGDDQRWIQSIGSTIQAAMPSHQGNASLEPQTDDMALIADVATNLSGCREEAVGRPLELFVIVEIAGELRVTRGAAFSYYEFKQPISQRLTDQQWRAQLEGAAPPAMPAWLNGYFDAATSPAQAPRHVGDPELPWGALNVTASPQAIQTGENLVIEVRPGWTPRAEDAFTLQLRLPNQQTTTTLALSPVSSNPARLQGVVNTTYWQGGECFIEGQAFSSGKLLARFRTAVPVIKRNGLRGELWRRFE